MENKPIGQPPKLNTAPLMQLDTSNKYYKIVIDGMMTNFKRAVNKASERSFSLQNATNSKPITLIGTNGLQQEIKVTISDIHIDGINNPKVTSVYVNKKNVKLHVGFNFKSIKVTGRCTSSPKQQGQQSPNNPQHSIIMEASNWNTSWSANVLSMIGRDHFDLNRVYTTHGQQRLSANLKECPQVMHDRLKAALIERVKSTIDSRLIEIMETVIIHTDSLLMNPEDTSSPSNPLFSNNKNDKVTRSIPAATVRRDKRGADGKQQAAAKSAKGSTRLSEPSSPREPNPIVASAFNEKKHTSKSERGLKTKSRNQGALNKKAPRPRGVSESLSSSKPLKRTKRQTPCQQGEELDDYVDQLFRFGTRLVRAMEPISLPNATIELPDYNLKIFLYEGKGTRAYKFRRAKSAWVFCSNETISLGVTVEVEDLRVAYKYRVISGTRLIFDGDLEARLSPRAQAQLSQAVQEEDSEEPVQQRIDRVRLFRLGRVFVLIRGLGNLTQSLSMIINGYLNDNQEDLQPTFRMVEGDAVRLLNRFLANVNLPILSVV